MSSEQDIVAWLREATPYFQRHRDRTFVVYIDGAPGETLDDAIRDLVLMSSVGVRLVLVFGIGDVAQGPIDETSIKQITAEAGGRCLEFEALFGASSQYAVRVVSGNYVKAQPKGVISGVDLGHAGNVRRIDAVGINGHLGDGGVVLIPPVGHSSTGELFTLEPLALAQNVAVAINADKLILLAGAIPHDADGTLIRQLTVREAREYLAQHDDAYLATAVDACASGVARTHIVAGQESGSMLRELFTRDGAGTLVSNVPFDQLRRASSDDVAGILDIIRPLEDDGILVRRPREKLEAEIENFFVVVRDDTVCACGALYPLADEDAAEIACIAVHPDYRGSGFGDLLMDAIESEAATSATKNLFVLTTQSEQWFKERGFEGVDVADLPVKKQVVYNYQRGSKVLRKVS